MSASYHRMMPPVFASGSRMISAPLPPGPTKRPWISVSGPPDPPPPRKCKACVSPLGAPVRHKMKKSEWIIPLVHPEFDFSNVSPGCWWYHSTGPYPRCLVSHIDLSDPPHWGVMHRLCCVSHSGLILEKVLRPLVFRTIGASFIAHIEELQEIQELSQAHEFYPRLSTLLCLPQNSQCGQMPLQKDGGSFCWGHV